MTNTTQFIRPENMEDLARDLGLGAYASRSPVPDASFPAVGSPLLRKDGNDFLFMNLPYQGSQLLEIRLLGALLENGAKKNHADWIAPHKLIAKAVSSATAFYGIKWPAASIICVMLARKL